MSDPRDPKKWKIIISLRAQRYFMTDDIFGIFGPRPEDS